MAGLRLAAIGEGILDAADTRIMEARRAPTKIDRTWDARKRQTIDRAREELERRAEGFAGINIGLIAAGCALGKLDFRFPDEPWRPRRPALARWYEGFATRPSMAPTVTARWHAWEGRA